MKKKALALILASTMALALAACGGQAAAPAPAAEAPAAPAAEEAPAEEEEEAPAEEVAEEPAEEEAAGGDLINVGFAQVGHESDWRTASTKSCQDVFSEANGYNLSLIRSLTLERPNTSPLSCSVSNSPGSFIFSLTFSSLSGVIPIPLSSIYM